MAELTRSEQLGSHGQRIRSRGRRRGRRRGSQWSRLMAAGGGGSRARCGKERGHQRAREHFCIGIRDVGRSLLVGWSWSLQPVRSLPTITTIEVNKITSKASARIFEK